MNEVVIGVRKDDSRPYYASFWFLDHKDGDWSVHQSRRDALAHWRKVVGREYYKPDLTWIKCSERGDLIEWMNTQRKSDMKSFQKRLVREKQFIFRSLVGIGDEADDGN